MRITLVQSSILWGDVDGNLERFGARLAQRLDTDIILLPEMFPCGSAMTRKAPEEMRRELADHATRYGEVCALMEAWAKAQNAAVIGSTVYGEGGQYYNRAVVAFPDSPSLHYDKRHCFRMGGEQDYFTAGHERLVFSFRGAKIAIFICYDLRFPVWCRNTDRYDVAVFTANWPEARREVWNALLRARAIENQAFAAGVNCVGTDAGGLRYAGDSAVWDARGKRCGGAEEHAEETVTVACDLEALDAFRQKFAVLENRDEFEIT